MILILLIVLDQLDYQYIKLYQLSTYFYLTNEVLYAGLKKLHNSIQIFSFKYFFYLLRISRSCHDLQHFTISRAFYYDYFACPDLQDSAPVSSGFTHQKEYT